MEAKIYFPFLAVILGKDFWPFYFKIDSHNLELPFATYITNMYY